jgi:hypothetical protein
MVCCFIAALAALGDAAPVAAQPAMSDRGGAFTLMVTPVFEHPLPLDKDQAVTCETRNLSAGGDPVLHILSPAADLLQTPPLRQRTEFVRNDNIDGGLSARVTFTAPQKRSYLLVLRANRPTTLGVADVFCDGALVAERVPFGGAFMRLVNLRRQEVLQTVPLARGPHAHQLYLLDPDGRHGRQHH